MLVVSQSESGRRGPWRAAAAKLARANEARGPCQNGGRDAWRPGVEDGVAAWSIKSLSACKRWDGSAEGAGNVGARDCPRGASDEGGRNCGRRLKRAGQSKDAIAGLVHAGADM